MSIKYFFLKNNKKIISLFTVNIFTIFATQSNMVTKKGIIWKFLKE